MLKIENLSFRYNSRSPLVLDGLSMELPRGEIGILLGRNGSGKTTLFQNILGICTPQSGSISLGGEELTRLSQREKARRIAYVPQHIHFGSLSVYDSILLGRVSYFGFRAGHEDYEAVDRIIDEMGLSDYACRNAEELSGGEKQKIAIARALAQEPSLLVFDEPTGNLDMANEELIIEEARKLSREKGISILSSLHDLNQALYFGDRFFFLRDGRICRSGTGEAVTAEAIRETFGISAEIIEHEGRKIILCGNQYGTGTR